MKYIKTIFVLGTMVFINMSLLPAQDKIVVTEKFNVHGVCDQCKQRIENAAYIKGVKHCEWDKQTETITVIYNTKKTSIGLIHKSIAEAGHSTSKLDASEEAYKKLPECCAYKDGVHKH